MSDTTNRGHAERMACLEQIAADTREVLSGIRSDLNSFRSEVTAEFRSIRTEMTSFRSEMTAEFRAIREDAKAHRRWLRGTMLVGFACLLGVMGHGFHWL